jgi:Flp pilus assembly protein TadD
MKNTLKTQDFAVACCFLVVSACSPANQEGRVDLAGRGASGSGAPNAPAKAALDLADHERAIGDYAGAISFYRRALELDPQQRAARLGLGNTLLDVGSPNDAADIFQKMLNQSPHDPAAEAGYGEALLALDQPAAAADRLRKALAAAPAARSFRDLGIAEDLLGEFPQAEADYRRGLELAPGDLSLRDDFGLSQILAGNFDGGIATLRAVATGPGATAAHRLNLALGLGLAGRTDDAERIARADLDERAVQSNMAYYAMLRGLSPKDRAEALLRPAVAPSSKTATGK